MPSACTNNQSMHDPQIRTGTGGAQRARGCKTSPRQPPCWQRGDLPSVGTMPVDGRSPGSQVVVFKGPSGSPRLPRVYGNTKERTIRRERGVLPRLIVLPPQWLFRPAVFERPVAPCDPSPSIPAERMENPRCNTVAGSAAFGVPGWGPRLRIPFCSPDNTSAVRKPSMTRIRPRSKPSQSQLRRRAASLRPRVD